MKITVDLEDIFGSLNEHGEKDSSAQSTLREEILDKVAEKIRNDVLYKAEFQFHEKVTKRLHEIVDEAIKNIKIKTEIGVEKEAAASKTQSDYDDVPF